MIVGIAVPSASSRSGSRSSPEPSGKATSRMTMSGTIRRESRSRPDGDGRGAKHPAMFGKRGRRYLQHIDDRRRCGAGSGGLRRYARPRDEPHEPGGPDRPACRSSRSPRAPPSPPTRRCCRRPEMTIIGRRRVSDAAAERPDHLEPALVGKLDVEDEAVIAARSRRLQRFACAVLDAIDEAIVALQHAAQEVRRIGAAPGRPGYSGRAPLSARGSGGGMRQRES